MTPEVYQILIAPMDLVNKFGSVPVRWYTEQQGFRVTKKKFPRPWFWILSSTLDSAAVVSAGTTLNDQNLKSLSSYHRLLCTMVFFTVTRSLFICFHLQSSLFKIEFCQILNGTINATLWGESMIQYSIFCLKTIFVEKLIGKFTTNRLHHKKG